MSSSDIVLYTAATPNGYKVTIYLELLGLKYEAKDIDIRANVQKEDWFIKLNPNGRIPTLIDNKTGITISETGAILQYLADTYDKDHKYSFAHGTKEYYLSLEVLTFQTAGVGPMQGQANHFSLFAPEKIPYGIKRYYEETKRLYSVLELYLERNEKGDYLTGDRVTFADVATYPWVAISSKIGVDLKEFPVLSKWAHKLHEIPAFRKGLTVPVTSPSIPEEFAP